MDIIKVTFKPKYNAPVCCKEVSYLVNELHIGLALSIAKEVFKAENVNYNYYRDAIAAKQRVL